MRKRHQRSVRSKLVGGIILSAASFLTAPANASSSTAGYVFGILAGNVNKVFFTQNGTRTTRPACATIDRWVFDYSTTAGLGFLTLLNTAYATGHQVTIVGTGACGDWGDTETAAGVTTVP